MRYKNSYLSYFLMYNFYYFSWALFSALISVYLMGKGFKASEVSLVVSSSFLVSTLKNLSAILFQNVAGYILDATSYSFLFGVCFICMLGGLLLFAFFKIESGNHKRLFS